MRKQFVFRARARWHRDLVLAIATYNRCGVIVKGSSLFIVGRDSNKEKTQKQFKELLRVLRAIGKDEHPRSKDRRRSFLDGLSAVLCAEFYAASPTPSPVYKHRPFRSRSGESPIVVAIAAWPTQPVI